MGIRKGSQNTTREQITTGYTPFSQEQGFEATEDTGSVNLIAEDWKNIHKEWRLSTVPYSMVFVCGVLIQ